MEKRKLGSQGLEVSALDLGVTFLDTADAYGQGRNEELVGRATHERSEWVIMATKFGNVRNPDGSFKGVDGRPDYVRAACDASLKRSGLEAIDLYYQHRVEPLRPVLPCGLSYAVEPL